MKEEVLRLNQKVDSKTLKIKELEGLIVRIVEQVSTEYKKNIQATEPKITQKIEKKFQKQFEIVGDCNKLVQQLSENLKTELESQEKTFEIRFAELSAHLIVSIRISTTLKLQTLSVLRIWIYLESTQKQKNLTWAACRWT